MSINFEKNSFWFRNGIRALLIYLWYDHGRSMVSDPLHLEPADPLLIIVSIILVLAVEGSLAVKNKEAASEGG